MTTDGVFHKVSVILPTHNRRVLLTEAIDSLLKQSFTDWEAIVVDDASSPAATIPGDPRIRIIRHESSRGGAVAKNTGVAAAKGEIVAFLDDDDLLAPSYLSRAVEVLDADTSLELVFMGVEWFGARGAAGQAAYDKSMAALLGKTRGQAAAPGLLTFDRDPLISGLLNSVPMAFQRPVVRRTSFEHIGPYQPDILLWDCDWALRAALAVRCALLTDGLYLQRAEGQGYSSQHDRSREQAQSNRLMKERLLATTTDPYLRKVITSSLASLWFESAWNCYLHGQGSEALKCCINSLKRRATSE